MSSVSTTVDPEEIARFSRIAEEWWDEHGKFRPLHQLGPARIGYIRDQACRHFGRTSGPQALAGLHLLDIGCGGGLMAEPMCRLGAQVTAIDAGERNVAVARLHAEQSGLIIDYRATTAEALLDEAPRYDLVLALEIIEHVADVEAFVQACAGLLKPGGLLVLSTLNRTVKSYGLAIIGAEYVLRWLPRGTHQWKKFLRPSEVAAVFRREGLRVEHKAGLVFNPLKRQWRIAEDDLDVNYLMTAAKPA